MPLLPEDCKDGSKRRLSCLTRSFEVQFLPWQPCVRDNQVVSIFFSFLNPLTGVIFVLQADDSVEVPEPR